MPKIVNVEVEKIDGSMFKTEDDAEIVERQIRLMTAVYPDFIAPYNVHTIDAYTYSYDYIEGRPATLRDLPLIVEHANNFLWDNVQPIIGVPEYAGYINRITYKHGISIPATLNILNYRTFHKDLECKIHGDMTFENIIISEKVPVFIDMGMPRGECVIELDYGKLMQSAIFQWEKVKRNIIPATDPVNCLSDELLAMLISHLVRILPHKERHSETVLKYVKGKVCDYENILRHRRCTDQF